MSDSTQFLCSFFITLPARCYTCLLGIMPHWIQPQKLTSFDPPLRKIAYTHTRAASVQSYQQAISMLIRCLPRVLLSSFSVPSQKSGNYRLVHSQADTYFQSYLCRNEKFFQPIHFAFTFIRPAEKSSHYKWCEKHLSDSFISKQKWKSFLPEMGAKRHITSCLYYESEFHME